MPDSRLITANNNKLYAPLEDFAKGLGRKATFYKAMGIWDLK